MNKTKIEYLDYTWDPIAMRCSPVSDGCRHCWHLAMAKRLAANPFCFEDQRKAYAGGEPSLQSRELTAPLRLRKPSRIGVQFMGDLFHDSLPEDTIIKVLTMVDQASTWIQGGEHTFFFLTKRPKRMKSIVEKVFSIKPFHPERLWLGVSAEDQKTADERIPILLQIPAAKRFVSVEPMLGPVDLNSGRQGQLLGVCDLCNGEDPKCPGCYGTDGLEWVVVGGETGPRARPLHPDWVRSLRDQCQAAGVPFFLKSWGEWNEVPHIGASAFKYEKIGKRLKALDDHTLMDRLGHKNTGHLLDGKEYREVPK